MKRILIALGGLITLIVGGAALAASGPTEHPQAVLGLAAHTRRSPATTPGTATRPPATRTVAVLQTPAAPRATSTPRVATPRPRATGATRVPTPSATRPARPVATAATARPVALLLAAPTRYLLLDPATAAPGAAIGVRGGGFAPGAVLHLTVNAVGHAPLAGGTVTADPTGHVQSTLVVPADETAPTVQVAAQDASGPATTATLLLRLAPPLAGLAPNVVTPGQHASLWIAGFRPGETVRVYVGRLPTAAGSAGQDRPLLVATAGSDGRGSWPVAIPYGAGGTNQLVAIGDRSRAPATASYLLLNLYPHAGVSSYAPQPGTHISFYGGGFGPGEPVTLHLDGWDGPVLAQAQATIHGGLPRLGPYRVPYGLTGTHLYLLRGEESHAMTAVGLTVEPFFASASPSTYAAGPGTTISFYGQGFAPHEIVRVYLDRTDRSPGTEVAALRTTAVGTLILRSGSYMLPATVHGPQIHFTLVGDVSGAEATTMLQYLAPPGQSVLVGGTPPYHAPARQHATDSVVAAPVSGPVLIATPPRVVSGGRVALWGTGFVPYSTVHLVATSPANPQGWALGTARSDRTGTLQATVTLPPWVAQANAVRAYGGTAGNALTVRAELEVESPVAQVIPATYSGRAGARYRLPGSGFTPGEQVGLYLDSVDTPPLALTTSSGDGRIAFDGVSVPVAAAGAHTFIVRGARGEVAIAPFTLDGWTPYLLLSTYSSKPERPVTVQGQGFAPGETVHLFLGSPTGPDGRLVSTTTADANGAVQATNAFTIPTSARGALTVVAVGATIGQAVRATLDVQPFGPSLWLSGYAGHPGNTVSFTGTGFARDDQLDVYVGDAATPAATFRAHDGAFANAGAVRLPYSTPGGMLRLTVRGRLSDAKVTLRYLVVPYTPGAGFEVRRRHGVTTLRLGAGGFAPGELVQVYVGADADTAHRPARMVRADKAGNLPLWPVLQVRGVPRARLTYTLIGVDSGTKATALYVPPRPRKRQP